MLAFHRRLRPYWLLVLLPCLSLALLAGQRGAAYAQRPADPPTVAGADPTAPPPHRLPLGQRPVVPTPLKQPARPTPPVPFAPQPARPPVTAPSDAEPAAGSRINPPNTQDLEGSYVYWVTPSPVNAGETIDVTFYVWVESYYSYENMYDFEVQLPGSWTINYTYTNYEWYGCYPQYYGSSYYGQIVYWYAYTYDPYFCGAWAPYYYYAFSVNVTVNNCDGNPWDFYWYMYGDYSYWSGVYSSVGCNSGGPDPIPTPLNTLFFDGFESGFTDWSANGLWNLESQSETCGAIRSPLPSPTYAAYYGVDGACTYDVGYSSGELTMLGSVPLPANAAGATLSFSSYEETECSGGCYYDQRWVEISTDGGANWSGLAQLGTEYTWYTASYSLNGYLGQNIKLRFRFDTMDGVVNEYFGWMIDNVTITVDGYPCNTVGYYDMDYGEGNSYQVASINQAGKTARLLTNLTLNDLKDVNVLYVQNPNNDGYGGEYLSNLGNIATAVSNGMVLIIHDRYVDGAETILPGGSGFTVVRDFADDANIDIRDYATSVTSGPGGALDNSSLDGGTSSSHGYAAATSLPRTARLILTRGNPQEVVTFSYQYGFGKVIYSSIPLDYYLYGGWPNFSDVYAPNVIAHACEIAVLPVSVASFSSRQAGDQIILTWTTATETGNVGFNVYAATDAGRRQLNANLIPSAVVSGVTPHQYTFATSADSRTRFYLEDIDLRGNTRLHGPFELGQTYGNAVTPDPIDWSAIGAEQARLTAARTDNLMAHNRAALAATELTAGPTADGGINLLVRQTGLYRVRFEDLVPYGLKPSGLPARRVALLNRDQPTPIFLRGDWFGPGSYFEFYGVAEDSLYSAVNVYTLRLDPSQAARIPLDKSTVPATEPAAYYLETLTIERQNGYSFIAPNGDPWYDTLLMAYGADYSQDFTFEVHDLAADGPTPVLQVALWGLTEWEQNPDHHIQVALNGALLADDYFDALAVHLVSVTLPPDLLHNGVNSLTLTVPFDLGVGWDMIYLDKFSLTYAHTFIAVADHLSFQAEAPALLVSGLTDPQAAVYRQTEAGLARLRTVKVIDVGDGTYAYKFRGSADRAAYLVASEAGYLTPELAPAQPYTDITSGSADYLIITHPSFLTGLEALVQFHSQAGLTVKVVDVSDIYAQFSAGIFDPQAIKAYLTHAVTQMGVQYVLLVGGDTYDYRDYLGLGSLSFIPSLYGRTEPYVDFAPLDPLYVDVDGNQVPDAAIGRFPVRTTAELADLINKTLAYADKEYAGAALLAADANEGDISFTGFGEEIAGQLEPDWTVTRAYLDDLGLAGARAALLDGLNDGVALTSFMGHSGPASWTFSGLFSSADAAALTNAGRPTLVTQWGCWNTYYVDPYYNTLAHQFMLAGDRGAAAVLGATTITATRSDQALGLRVLPRLTTPGVTIGQAVQAAKADLALTQPALRDVILGWTLLGDPALVVEP